MNLHFGCGLSYAPGWYDCDSSPTLRLQRLPVVGIAFRKWLKPLFPSEVHVGDIVRGLSISPGSCEAIYCCHVLEHLSLEDLRFALQNTYSYLKVGGSFRFVIPDFEQQVAAYIKSSEPTAASDFLRYTFLGREVRPRGLREFAREYFGNSHHLWMWDYKGLKYELEAVGFHDIRRCECGDAKDPAFAAVEDPERFKWSLAVECKK